MMLRAIIFAAVTAICPALAWADAQAKAAFARGDYATAQSIWQQEADAGVAEAMLGLGLLADRGFGQPRDLDVAYDWYLKAAEAGLAEAQFNVAILLDAGLGRPRDARAAQVWYTRAALRGHARAQYNLGLLFETGDGIAANPQMASFWFDRAADEVPAARGKTIAPVEASDELVIPEILFSRQSDAGLELVWTARSSAFQSYLLEVAAVPDIDVNYIAPVIAEAVSGSGVFKNSLSSGADQLIWRIIHATDDGSDYVASPWRGSSGADMPDGRITLLYEPDLPAMRGATEHFAQELRAAGFWVRTESRRAAEGEKFYVAYGFAADQSFAERVAAFLPAGNGPSGAGQRNGISQPGEIIVDLAAFR